MITLSDTELDQLIRRVARITLAEAGLASPQISQRQAISNYGRERITMWRRRGIVNPIRQGSRIYYSVAELAVAHKTNLI